MGSVSPPDDDSDDDNNAFVAVRSREEAVARDERRNRARGYSDALAPVAIPGFSERVTPVSGGSTASNDDSTLANDVGVASSSNPEKAKEQGKPEVDVAVEKTDEEWMVRFEKGDPANPKVSVLGSYHSTCMSPTIALLELVGPLPMVSDGGRKSLGLEQYICQFCAMYV